MRRRIKIEATTPYSPSQNGIVEQFNCTIIELVQAMILAHNVPKNLWHKAINHATYIWNKSFTHAIKGKTPKEGYMGHIPDVSHLQEFVGPILSCVAGFKMVESFKITFLK